VVDPVFVNFQLYAQNLPECSFTVTVYCMCLCQIIVYVLTCCRCVEYKCMSGRGTCFCLSATLFEWRLLS